MGSAQDAASYVSGTLGGSQYLSLKQQAYDRLVDYYNTLGK
jgi:hypothetical protein